MNDSYPGARRDLAILPPEARTNGSELLGPHPLEHDLASEPGDGGRQWLDVLTDQLARALPCGGRCERFGSEGCHSRRCRVGGQ
jgi:hypothetical protein